MGQMEMETRGIEQARKFVEAMLFPATEEESNSMMRTEAMITRFLRTAGCFIGTTEKPKNSNRGDVIDSMQAAFDMRGQPYCMIFIVFLLKALFPKLAILKTASTQTFYSWAKKRGYVFKDPSGAKPGDIIIWRKYKLWQGHAGVIKKMSADKQRAETIEANTTFSYDSDEGRQREGGGIWARMRSLKKVAFRPDAFYIRGIIDTRKMFGDSYNG